jgi:hypothetical protein
MGVMPIIRAQVIIPAASTVAEDTITNSWHFTTTGWDETIRGQIAGGLQAFYESWDAMKGNLQAWTSARVKFFDLDEPEPRVPLDDVPLSLTSAPAGSPLPPEVSACLSFRGDYVSGSSQARRRGRVYLGGLSTAALTTDSRLSSTMLTNATGGATTFLALSDSSTEWAWVVYSPTSGTAYPVTAGWMDNAPDIQRRRGLLSTSRTLFS